MVATLAQVALGGAIGALCRFLTVQAAVKLFGTAFPVGTMVVNVVGSFVMGALFIILAERDALRFAPFLMSGILVGFTTFSAFSLDAFRLYEDGAVGLALTYVVGSVVLSIAALVLGILAARAVGG